ncbi:MAG TPA: hypothetical protein VLT16_10095 [Candidatus Limnocylindrales bacterium]|nr:hypothetical protein [Candidatus Limnocylindrales bacterium]
MEQRVTPGKPRRGCLTQLIFLLIIFAIVGVGIPALLTPWGFFMGGRFHVIPMWQGLGRMHSTRAGGDYVLYMWFYPKVAKGTGTTHVTGYGELCTPRGERFFLSVGGDFEKTLRLDTNGKTAKFYMDNRSTMSRLSGKNQPYLELRGKWSNPDLVMDDHGSIARAFEPDATLYMGHSPSRPYMAEVVPVTLHEGGKQEFNAACKAVKTR